MAYVGKYIDKAPYRVYCLIGDGESAEGSIWEALSFASVYKLDNLVAIFDINRLGQSDATPFGHHMDIYKNRLQAFGFDTQVVDGHDVKALVDAFDHASNTKNKPQAIVAQTFKGKGIKTYIYLINLTLVLLRILMNEYLVIGFVNIEDKEKWHGTPLGDKAEEIIKAITQKIKSNSVSLPIKPPTVNVPAVKLDVKLSEPPNYKLGEKVS
jgi:transketolase